MTRTRARKSSGTVDLGRVNADPHPSDPPRGPAYKVEEAPDYNLADDPNDPEGAGWIPARGLTPEQSERMIGEFARSMQSDPALKPYYEAAAIEADIFDTISKTAADSATAKRLYAVTEEDSLQSLNDEMRGWTSDKGYGLGEFSSATRQRLQRQCFYLYYRDGFARNIINAYTYLTVGDGIQVLFPDDEEGRKAADRWEIIAKLNHWEARSRKIIRQTYLLGEWFVVRWPLLDDRFLTDKEYGYSDLAARSKFLQTIPPEKIRIRFMEPEEIKDQTFAWGDRETVVAFNTSLTFQNAGVQTGVGAKDKKGKRRQATFWADDVTHFKNDDIGVFSRGRSILEPVMRELQMRRLLLLDRVTLGAIRTRMPLWIGVPGGPAAVGAKRTMLQERGLPRPGTVWVSSDKNTITYPALNLGAADAWNDYRMVTLAIGAGTALPEFILTGDASNSNQASTLTSASPLVPMISEHRAVFGEQMADMIEELTGVRPTIPPPVLTFERLLDNVQANQVLKNNGILSKGTFAARTGIRWAGRDGEKVRLEAERDEEQEEQDALDLEAGDDEDPTAGGQVPPPAIPGLQVGMQPGGQQPGQKPGQQQGQPPAPGLPPRPPKGVTPPALQGRARTLARTKK